MIPASNASNAPIVPRYILAPSFFACALIVVEACGFADVLADLVVVGVAVGVAVGMV